MSLVRNGCALSTRRGFLGVSFSALLALALFDSSAAVAQEVKQIKLTEKQIESLLGAAKGMTQRSRRGFAGKARLGWAA
jgi:hypothetical protein